MFLFGGCAKLGGREYVYTYSIYIIIQYYIYINVYIHRHVYFRPEMLGCNDYQSQKLHFWEDRMNTADSEETGPNFEEPTIWPTIWISRRRSSREINTSIRRNIQMIKNISSLYWIFSVSLNLSNWPNWKDLKRNVLRMVPNRKHHFKWRRCEVVIIYPLYSHSLRWTIKNAPYPIS